MRGACTPSSALSCQSQNEEQLFNKQRVLHELVNSTLQSSLRKLLPSFVFQILEVRYSYETFDRSAVSLDLNFIWIGIGGRSALLDRNSV